MIAGFTILQIDTEFIEILAFRYEAFAFLYLRNGPHSNYVDAFLVRNI